MFRGIYNIFREVKMVGRGLGVNELDYKRDVVSILRGIGFDVQAHEDAVDNFIPDLSFAFAGKDGWVELKYLNKLPRNLDAIPHYTYGQQEWLINRGFKGSGNCFLLVGSPRKHFLWYWRNLKMVRGLPWDDAVGYAMIEDTVGGACHAISAAIERGYSYIHRYIAE
jgi:hypothetical protein